MAVTHHKLSSEQLQQEKPLAFVMDPPKTDRDEGGKPLKKKAKKEKDPNKMTNKNFGSVVDIPKLKGANRIVIGWRLRFNGCPKASGLYIANFKLDQRFQYVLKCFKVSNFQN